MKENEIFNDLDNFIGSVNVDNKKECVVVCFEVDDCLLFLYRYNIGGLFFCFLFKIFILFNGIYMLNSYFYVVKC